MDEQNYFTKDGTGQDLNAFCENSSIIHYGVLIHEFVIIYQDLLHRGYFKSQVKEKMTFMMQLLLDSME